MALRDYTDLSSGQLIGITFGLWCIFSTLIYPFLLSPVRHIPGPWYARISKIPLQYATFQRRRTKFVSGLLDKYGSIVVIAPDQVHTTDESAMKIIYDKSSIKTSFYSSMGSWKGVKSTLGFVDYSSAAPSRNNLIQCFQNRNLAVLVESIESHIDDFLRLIKRSAASDSAVDGVVVFRLLALDIVTDVLWGETNTLLSNESPSNTETPVFLRRFHAFSTYNATKSFIPGVDLFVRFFGSKRWKQLRKDCSDMDVTAREALERWKDPNTEKQREKDVLSMLQSMNSAKADAVPTNEVPAYMVEMLAAGSSTTSHSAAFACWLLTRHSKAQDRLRQELFEAYPNVDKDFDITLTMDLPYLDGVIREAMRLYPMIPGPLERHLGKNIVVDGKSVPKGVVASTAAYNQGRLEDVFPDHDAWKPERWIDADQRMRLNWTPFGYGSRSCPGSNLALTELKYMVGKIFRFYRAVIPPGQEDDVLELADVFAAGSKTGHCWLKFVEASKDCRGASEV